MDVKDIILAASIAKGAGGSGGGVTKEYVDNQVGAVSERVDDVEDVIPSTATAQNKLATTADVSEAAITSTSPVSPLTDSANGMIQGLTIYGRSKKSKNLLEITATTRTDSGITFTVKSDGTIIANGTATANAYLSLGTNTREYCVEGQSYVLSGSPGNGVVLYTGNWSDGWNDTGNGSTIIYSNSISNKIYIVINANSTVNNVVIKPMICTATDYAADPTFEQYFEGIKSVGDDGLTVITANSNNTVTTSAVFTTALPLRSTLDGTTRDELIIGNGKAEAITRCEVVDDNIVPLATPVTTPLTTVEISAFRQLRTYDSTTNITITDSPDFEVDYLKNTDNGQAVADIQAELQGQIDGLKIKTLAYTGTGSSTNTITFPEKPTVIFQIQTVEDPNNAVGVCPFIYGETGMFVWYASKFTTGNVNTYHSLLSYNGLSMTITGSDAGAAQNVSGSEYKVYYI